MSNLRDSLFFNDLLNEEAKKNWKTSLDVQILSIENHLFRDPRYLKGKIKKHIRTNKNIRYHVHIYRLPRKEIGFSDKQDRWNLIYLGHDKKVVQRKIILCLRSLRLDWFSSKADLLKHSWLRGSIDETHIKRWIEQFDKLHGHAWIGKNLLKTLIFWPEHQIINALKITPNHLEGFDKICLSIEKGGKSADILRNLISKSLAGYPECNDLSEIVTPKAGIDNPNASNILWVEDFLLSGTEVTSLIKSLMGETPIGRKPKTTPLSNKDFLFKKNLQFRYALATDFGTRVLHMLFDEKNMDNCELNCNFSIPVLTSEGKNALQSGTFFQGQEKKIISSPKKFLKLSAFSDSTIWQTTEKQNEAIAFCRKIGTQLFEHYINDQVKNKGWSKWSKRRIDQCAFGKNYLGLALAFAHTVPKASLPLFWWRGEVCISNQQRKKKRIIWHPLFPNTD